MVGGSWFFYHHREQPEGSTALSHLPHMASERDEGMFISLVIATFGSLVNQWIHQTFIHLLSSDKVSSTVFCPFTGATSGTLYHKMCVRIPLL